MWANSGDEILFGRAVLNKADDRISPNLGVFYGKIVTVKTEEMPHRLKGGALIALLERMSLRDAGQQSDGKHKNVLFAISERILRPGQGAFEQPAVAEEMRLPGFLYLKSIVLDNRSIQIGSLGKGSSDFRKPRHELTTQRCIIHFTLYRSGAQNLAFGRLTRRCRGRSLRDLCVVRVGHWSSCLAVQSKHTPLTADLKERPPV